MYTYTTYTFANQSAAARFVALCKGRVHTWDAKNVKGVTVRTNNQRKLAYNDGIAVALQLPTVAIANVA